MAIVSKKNALYSTRTRKKISRPNGYGEAVYAFSYFGHDNVHAGIYHQRKGVNGRINIKSKFYMPTNPRTIPQQANRAVFANAVSGWQGLTDEQKLEYNNRAVGKHMLGYNLYIREYMLAN